jgi:hypothetical protein
MGWVQFSIPSKVFVLGEYAVLKGAPALVATLSPRFTLSTKGPGKPLSDFPSESPVGRLLPKGVGHLLAAHFMDPHRGTGGFGGSTAEFALAYAVIHGSAVPVSEVWEQYLLLQPAASGADLAAQWNGGATIAEPSTKSVEKILAEPLLGNWAVFSAAHQPGRKVKTHDHLKSLAKALEGNELDELAHGSVLSGGLRAARAGDFDAFARSINDYGDRLRTLGFEIPQTTEDRKAFRDVSGVCAVKGTGAMQADALIVLGDPRIYGETERRDFLERLLVLAKERDLRLVSHGWREEAGISS